MFLRWVLIAPGALAALMVGSLAGGIALSLFGLLGQDFADTGSAFAGPLAFVFACCLIAPTQKHTVGLLAAVLITLLAIGTVVLSNFSTIEEFAKLSARARVVSPTAQVLGALYALFLGLPCLSPGTLLEALWREMRALGLLVMLLGILLAAVGSGFALAGYGWLGFMTGASVVLIGLLTWMFPFIHLYSKVNSIQKNL